VPTINRLLTIIGLFCRISSLLWGSFATETYYFKEPTNRSHPIRGPLRLGMPSYGMATISRLLEIQIIGVVCKRALKKRLYSTWNAPGPLAPGTRDL